MANNIKFWMGSTPCKCDACGGVFGTVQIDRAKVYANETGIISGRVMFDAATRHGPWGMLCGSCHKRIGVGLGRGKGQCYIEDTTAKAWVFVSS